MGWKDPMGDSSDPDSSNYGGGISDGGGGDSGWNDPENPAYQRGPGTYANPNYTGTQNRRSYGQALLGGVLRSPSMINEGLKLKDRKTTLNANGYDTNYGTPGARGGSGGGGSDRLTTYGSYGGSSVAGGSGSGSTGSGSGSIYPSVYTDPVTGRLLYKSQSTGGTSNQTYADQQMLDKIMGTNVSSQNLTQELSLLKQQRDKVAAAGGDTSWYDSELERLTALGGQQAPTGGIMDYLDTGLTESVANQNLDISAGNSLRAADEASARRGIGMSPLRDATRASLGLSTAMGKQQNKLDAQDKGFDRSTNLMAYLKGSQQQDYGQEMGRTGIGMTLGDWENQRKIAEIAQANQNSQFGDNMDFLRDQQSDTNRNAWIDFAGQAAGGIDWGSLF